MSSQVLDSFLGGVNQREKTLAIRQVDLAGLLRFNAFHPFLGLITQDFEHCGHVVQLLFGEVRLGLVVCGCLIIRSLQDSLYLTESELLASMKHLGCIVLVLFESLGMIGGEFLSARLDAVGGLVVVVDQAFGLGE